jgi:hypothetical protein
VHANDHRSLGTLADATVATKDVLDKVHKK